MENNTIPKNTQNNSDGCLWLFLLGLFSVIIFGVSKLFFNLSIGLTIFISIIIAIQLVTKILGKSPTKSILKRGIFVFIFLFVFQLIGNFILDSFKIYQPEKINFIIDEGVQEKYIIENNDSILTYTSHRQWNDNYGTPYKGKLIVRKNDYLKLKNSIDNYKVKTSNNFWGNLYNYIDKNDSPSLDLVLQTFNEILKSKNLNQMQFAEMVVTCIQDIPYSLVLQKECMPASSYEEVYKNILLNCPECCIGNIKYGIQNPVSFLKNLKGDCDTRTVLIYSILKSFNYDVAILNSAFYKHSILGINLPASGEYKIYNGKKYYLWETTAKYFEIGKLSSNFNNVNHWEVVLTSK
ncbi:MAG: hypothetical protein ACWA45_06435 [Flavobacteriales bacterium]